MSSKQVFDSGIECLVIKQGNHKIDSRFYCDVFFEQKKIPEKQKTVYRLYIFLSKMSFK